MQKNTDRKVSKAEFFTLFKKLITEQENVSDPANYLWNMVDSVKNKEIKPEYYLEVLAQASRELREFKSKGVINLDDFEALVIYIRDVKNELGL